MGREQNMAGEQNMASDTGSHDTPATDSPAWQARTLLRAARVGTLATSHAGQPFAALVTPATAPDLSILLLLSSLSEHTRHLLAERRCAVLITGVATTVNPQTAPRLTVTGMAEQIADPTLKARWLALHPYAALYADFADFSLWRIRPMNGLFVGGFARATRLRIAGLTPDPASVSAVAAGSADIINHCNTDHPAAVTRIARMAGGAAGDWRMVAVDVDGCDLAMGDAAMGDAVCRIAFSAPVTGPDGVRAELVRLAQRK